MREAIMESEALYAARRISSGMWALSASNVLIRDEKLVFSLPYTILKIVPSPFESPVRRGRSWRISRLWNE
jgi:hypothetical protein